MKCGLRNKARERQISFFMLILKFYFFHNLLNPVASLCKKTIIFIKRCTLTNELVVVIVIIVKTIQKLIMVRLPYASRRPRKKLPD